MCIYKSAQNVPKSKICKSFKLKVLRIDQEKCFKLNKILQLIDEEILSVDETKKLMLQIKYCCCYSVVMIVALKNVKHGTGKKQGRNLLLKNKPG